MALWRSWLARRPVTAEVAGSSPVRVAVRNPPSIGNDAGGFFTIHSVQLRLSAAPNYGAGGAFENGAVVLICFQLSAVCRVTIRAQRHCNK